MNIMARSQSALFTLPATLRGFITVAFLLHFKGTEMNYFFGGLLTNFFKI